MKASELRIGNIVYNYSIDGSGKKAGQPHLFTINNGYTLHTLSEHAEGIPLTKEWLLKFGFKKSSFGMIKNGVNITPGLQLYFSSNKKATILRVHQLQNLYFALTNTELELK